jgi:hypothetical protein
MIFYEIIGEANSQIFCRITTKQELDLVEGLTPSKRRKRRLQAEEDLVN